MLKIGTSLHLGCLVLSMTVAAHPALAQTAAPATASSANIKREPVTELKKTDISIGTGAEAVDGKTVTVNHTGWLFTYNPAKPDHKGSKIDDSLESGPATFQLGLGKMLKGWEQGIVGMKVGGKRTLIIPPELGYGSRSMGRGVIPANSALVYEIELTNVKQ